MLAVCLVLAGMPAQASVLATTSQGELAQAWRQYRVRSEASEPAMRFPFHHCFERAAKRYDLPLTLLLAVARGESDFEPAAKSTADALGLMQIQWPGTAKHLGITRRADLLDPCTNVDAGTRYLKELLGRFDQDIHIALAAYNFGPTAIAGRKGDLPAKAAWYSGYIYRHLDYVLGSRAIEAPLDYRDDRQLRLVHFKQPYRAEGFVRAIEARRPKLRLDWFDRGLGYYQVVLLYGTTDELKTGQKILQGMGIQR